MARRDTKCVNSWSKRRWVAFFAALIGFSALPVPAYAHEASATGGFVSGLLHPVSGLDHVLAMVAVGLWGAQLGMPSMLRLPVAFPMVMAVGGFLGLVGLPIPGVEIGIAVSAIILGAMVLTEARPPPAVALAWVAVFAVFHGHAHGTELGAHDNAVLYSLGFVISTGLLHAAGIALGLVHRWRAGRVALRAAGLVVLAGGMFFLWSHLR